jgi:hypothetical protein
MISALISALANVTAMQKDGQDFQRLSLPLQPISVQQQTGINVAAGVAEIELHFVR